MRWNLGATALVVLLLVPACSDEASEAIDVPVDETDATIGSQGGSLSSGDVALEIPAGALTDDVDFSIAESETPAAIDGVTTLGPTVEIGPSGTAFAVPATVTVPFVASALPTGREATDVRLYRADAPGGTYAALPSTVDVGASTVAAEVSGLSVFVAGVTATGGETDLCPTHGDCDCAARYEDRPLNILGSATLPGNDRRIRSMCWDSASDVLTVLSYVPDTQSSDPFAPPLAYYLTTFDGADLTQTSDDETETTEIETGLCVPQPLSSLDSAPDAELQWSVRFEERRGSSSLIEWFEEVLYVGALKASFNRHLNESEPYTDSNLLLDQEPLAAETRLLDDGTARFYVYSWHGQHIDVMQFDDLSATAANLDVLQDEDGYVEPDHIERIEIASGDSSFGYGYDPLLLVPDPGNDDADILVAFSLVYPGIQGYRVGTGVDGSLTVEALPELGLDEFYSQAGWHNLGFDAAGRLLAQSDVAGFSNSELIALDPFSFTVVATWEAGCLNAPRGNGSQAIPWATGQVLRFSFQLIDDTEQVMFVRDGEIEAASQSIPFHWRIGRPLALRTPEDSGRVYVADDQQGVVTAIDVP